MLAWIAYIRSDYLASKEYLEEGLLVAMGAYSTLDLWRNAERRAVQGRYDDAVARCYRMVEWTAQWLLRTRCNVSAVLLTWNSSVDFCSESRWIWPSR